MKKLFEETWISRRECCFNLQFIYTWLVFFWYYQRWLSKLLTSTLSEVCPTNTQRVFHVETTWKLQFPRRLKVEYTWCIYEPHNTYKETSWLKVQSCKLYSDKYMMVSTKITNTGIFAFIAVLVFKLLSGKFCLYTETKIEPFKK